MINRLAMFIGILVLTLLVNLPAQAQCTSDTDCEGQGVCNSQVCEYPGDLEPKPTPKDEESLELRTQINWFREFYVEIQATTGLSTWGELDVQTKYNYQTPTNLVTDTADVSAGVSPGGRFAIYYSGKRFFHVGAYFRMNGGSGKIVSELPEEYSWVPSEKESSFLTTGVGLATKIGFSPSEKIFLGIGLDAGLHFFDVKTWEDDKNFANHRFTGIEFLPEIVMDIMVADRGKGKLKVAIPIRVGVLLVPVATLEPYDYVDHIPAIENENGEEMWSEMLGFSLHQISLVASVGISLGR